MIHPASSEARNAAAAATSSGSPTRRSGYQRTRRSKIAGSLSTRSCQMGVRIVPGAIATARTPWRPYRVAMLRVRLISPALAALYGSLAKNARPLTEAMFTITPDPCSIIPGSTAFEHRYADLRLSSTSASHSSSSISSRSSAIPPPALLTSTSTRPAAARPSARRPPRP